MKAVVLAALVLLAAMLALWISISGDPAAAVVSEHHETKIAPPSPPEARPAPVAPRTATIPKATTPRPVPTHDQAPAPTPPPVLEAQGSGSDAKKVDPFRADLQEQVRFTEGAVAECVDTVKKKEPIADGDASYGIYLGRAEGKVVIEKVTTEYGPFPAALNDCITKSASGIVVDALPETMKHVAVFRGVRVVNGVLKRNSLLNYEVVDSVPN